MFHIPSRRTTGEIGVTTLVERRLQMEAKKLTSIELIARNDDEAIEKYNRNFGK